MAFIEKEFEDNGTNRVLYWNAGKKALTGNSGKEEFVERLSSKFSALMMASNLNYLSPKGIQVKDHSFQKPRKGILIEFPEEDSIFYLFYPSASEKACTLKAKRIMESYYKSEAKVKVDGVSILPIKATFVIKIPEMKHHPYTVAVTRPFLSDFELILRLDQKLEEFMGECEKNRVGLDTYYYQEGDPEKPFDIKPNFVRTKDGHIYYIDIPY